MAKSNIDNRVKFTYADEQKKFFDEVIEIIGTRNKVAQISCVSSHCVSDWKNAKTTVPQNIFERLLKITSIPRPTHVQVAGQYDHTSAAGKKGFAAVIKKYGTLQNNETHRKAMWQEWWKKTGSKKKQKILERKPISKPRKCIELAELCGILIGDGGITPMQVIITLNQEADREYSKYVTKLLIHLFGVKPKIYKVRKSKAMNICISRRDLVDFLHTYGIIIGHKLKQNLSIPSWIIQSKKYTIACIRGMMDTDGSVVRETHTINGKKYMYYRLNFTSASPALIDQTFTSLVGLGFTPKIRRGGRSIQLENLAEIWEYFKVIGSSNPKHKNRLGKLGGIG